MDRQTDGRMDKQMLDKVIPMCLYVSRVTQKQCKMHNHRGFTCKRDITLGNHAKSVVVSCSSSLFENI